MGVPEFVVSAFCPKMWIEDLQGVPKKMVIQKGFEFLTFGGVFVGVKIILRTFCFIRFLGLFSKILSKWILLSKEMQKII